MLGATDGSTYAECVRLSRLAWCALAVGTGQAVLDYVTPYVKERQAFGEPIAHRQSVAFMVADIAIELQSMRLLTYNAASRAARGRGLRPRRRAGPASCARARACGSASTASSCSGATASSRSTRWSGGTATSGPSASWKAACSSDAHINLEIPKKHRVLVDQAHQVAMNMLRPISRKYDRAEHAYPHELDMLAAMIDGLAKSGASEGAGAVGVRRDEDDGDGRVRNGANLASVLSIAEMCWGDTGLLLSMPRQGLGNSAIASVADEEQAERFAGLWASMAITEPGTGSDSANIATTATLDGDEYVINGEKIYVTVGRAVPTPSSSGRRSTGRSAGRPSSRSWCPRARRG